MQVNNRKYLVAVILLLATFVFIVRIDKVRGSTSSYKKLKQFPFVIGQWQGKDVAVDESAYEILETRGILVREYGDKDGDILALAIVYSDDNRAAFHPPEICYLGGGVELLEKKLETVSLENNKSFTVNTLTMKERGGVIKAWYWFATKDNFTHNYYLQQLHILFSGLIHNVRKGALIRVSARVNRDNSEIIEAKAEEFIKKIVPLAEKFLDKKTLD